MRRTVHRLGTALCVLGVLLVAWGVATWAWGDPITGLYTRRAQADLAKELEHKQDTFTDHAAIATRPAASQATLRREMASEARVYRAALHEGDAVGRLSVPRLGLKIVIVYGTSSGSLRRGPGLESHTFLPGQRRLVYVAGHRTTFLAPFAHIDSLRKGDEAVVEMPYGRFVYRVSRKAIVDDNDLSVLKPGTSEVLRLQACHPRFRATQRYIVSAPLVRVTRPLRTSS